MGASPKAFVRDATGLVKEFTWLDAFIISTGVILPNLYGISSQIFFVSSADPGANLVTSAHLGFIFLFPLALVYYFLSSAMPRSGGDYIWISRVVNPIIGFMAGWAFLISLLNLIGGGGGIIFGSVVVPVTLASFGYSSGNTGLVNLASTISSTPSDVFILGLVLILAATALTALHPRHFRRIMLVLFAVIILGTIVGFLVLATTSHSDFISDLNNYAGTGITYQGILTKAANSGISYVPLTLATTFVSLPLAVLAYNGFNYSSAASGEVRNVRKSMLVGVVFALIFGWIVLVIGSQLSVDVFGYQFLQATAALGSNWGLAAPAWIGFLTTILIHNSLVLFIVQLGWFVTLLWFVSNLLLVSTRYLFALSFDRALPTRLADVSAKYHNPLKAMFVNVIIACIFMYLGTFTSYIGLLLNSVAIWSIVWFLASLAAVIMPFRRKELMGSIPGSGWKFPLLSIIGVISMVLMAWNTYYAFTTPSVGPSTPGADAILAVIFVAGLVIYLGTYSHLKGKGIDLRKVYAEIPPE